MTSPAGRLYALALALVVFFLAWAVVAARPWASAATATDPRLKALAVREARLRREARVVEEVVSRRFAAYRVALRARRAEIAAARVRASQLAAAPAAAAPGVRIVTLPPLTITRTS
jgi:hypothetical protein